MAAIVHHHYSMPSSLGTQQVLNKYIMISFKLTLKKNKTKQKPTEDLYGLEIAEYSGILTNRD